jgi:hypothetical protein
MRSDIPLLIGASLRGPRHFQRVLPVLWLPRRHLVLHPALRIHRGRHTYPPDTIRTNG